MLPTTCERVLDCLVPKDIIIRQSQWYDNYTEIPKVKKIGVQSRGQVTDYEIMSDEYDDPLLLNDMSDIYQSYSEQLKTRKKKVKKVQKNILNQIHGTNHSGYTASPEKRQKDISPSKGRKKSRRAMKSNSSQRTIYEAFQMPSTSAHIDSVSLISATRSLFRKISCPLCHKKFQNFKKLDNHINSGYTDCNYMRYVHEQMLNGNSTTVKAQKPKKQA